MCSCHSIQECCVTFSGVKLSIRSFALFVTKHMCTRLTILAGSKNNHKIKVAETL